MNTITKEQACDSSNWRWRRWDIRADGKVFWEYQKKSTDVERWISWDNAIKRKKRYYARYGSVSQDNRRKANESLKKWRNKNRGKTLMYERKRRDSGYFKKYRKTRRKKDPIFVMRLRLTNRILNFLQRRQSSKISKTQEMLGCDWSHLKAHLESKFTDGMSWENRGLWHVDHIIPLASAKSIEEVVRLCHYTNLQPLWAEDNLKKGSKIIS
jgi:hypothetical protein